MSLNNHTIPKISIVSPSYNQGIFLEQTMLSVLDQGYPNLEYIVIDGGSSDNSLEIIKKYENRLAYWVSEQDNGQYHAINKGFGHATGEIMAWLNSDDVYFPWALQCVGEIFSKCPEVEWITTCYPMALDERGLAVNCCNIDSFLKDSFFKGEFLPGFDWYAHGWIQQESTFWRRSLWENSGAFLDDDLQLAGDFELWCRFFQHAYLYGVKLPLAGFRCHGTQKTATRIEKYKKEALDSFVSYGGVPRGKKLSWLMQNVPNIYKLGATLFCLNRNRKYQFIRNRRKHGWVIEESFLEK